MVEFAAEALDGRNPLGLFAALGALDVATRRLPDRAPTLHWQGRLRPKAVFSGPDSIDHLVELCVADLERWRVSPVLGWTGPEGAVDDLKLDPIALRQWIDTVLDAFWRTGDRADIDMLSSLVADGATAGKGDSKPTHFHFTAGQQRFLRMARELAGALVVDHFEQALRGPWKYDDKLPDFGWDARGERIYALQGFNPANQKRSGVPGANWLGLLGLRFFPVTVRAGQLVTTGCGGRWKSGSFTWPLWSVPLPSPVVGSLLGDPGVVSMSEARLKRLGVDQVLVAPIRRTSQGGYGSFGAPEPLGS
jgi:hypothetical protein